MARELNYLQQYLAGEFLEDYVERHLTRREALGRICGITGSFAVAGTLLAACTPAPAAVEAEKKGAAGAVPPATTGAPPSTPAAAPSTTVAQGERVQFAGSDGHVMGYLALPAGSGPFAPVLVCHENRGLTDHIRDVTRRVAQAGYIGLAVDLLSRQGGTGKVTDAAQVPGLLGRMPMEQLVGDFRAGYTYLQSRPETRKGAVGMVGFCLGGGVTWLAAGRMPELKAAVPCYGPNPPLGDVPNVRAAVLAMYGERDTRINQGIPPIEEAMRKDGKTFEKMVYPGAGHGFRNATAA